MSKTAYPFDYATITDHRRKTRRELLNDGSTRIKKKIAVLGGSTTNDFIKTLEIFLLSEGIEPTFYESEYNRFWQDAMFENLELREFQPDIIYIHTSFRNIYAFLPSPTESAEDVNLKLEQRFDYYRRMWDKLRRDYKCPIIQNIQRSGKHVRCCQGS